MSPSNVRCNTCGHVSEKKLHVIEHGGRCNSCFPLSVSRWQQEITDFVKTLVGNVITNDRAAICPLELDIYVPSAKFAIECNGIYWHSEAISSFDRNHTENKRLQVQAAGISLLTIFEDEWRDKRTIIMSMIKHRLRISTSIGARELRLERCQPGDVASSLDDWHLEGHVNSSYALRLVTKGGVTMGVCSLRWARGTARQILEVARIAFFPGMHVPGGISRFIKEAMQWARELGATKLLSYSDNRLGTGTGYALAGMQLDGITTQRFWWTDFYQRHDRFKFRADSSRGLTERQVAQEAGVHRIYGCSNSRWTIDL